MKVKKLEKIVPDPGLWRKPLEYYKEYMSYVERFNKVLEQKETKDKS
jgi:hypothetical protein